MWTVCPKLRFDGAAMRGQDVAGTQHYTQKFIDNVNGVLNQYHGKVVEEFEVKFEFDATLAEHLDCWVNFALSSRAKNLALDLLPVGGSVLIGTDFPLSCLMAKAYPVYNTYSLALCLLIHLPNSTVSRSVTRKGLEHMLSNCSNFEWLSIVRCHLDNDELRMHRRLPCLLYLHVMYCEAQNMILNCSLPLKKPRPQGNGSKFSLLKYLQLKFLVSPEDLANLMFLASFLSAAPFIEKLEIHFSICTLPHGSELIRRLPGSTHIAI